MQQGDFGSATLVESAARTASFNSDAEAVQSYDRVWAYLDITAASGTSPTLDIIIQESVDGTTWYDSGYSFTQSTATGKQRLSMPAVGGYFIRASCTIAGTSPSFTFSVDVVGKQN